MIKRLLVALLILLLLLGFNACEMGGAPPRGRTSFPTIYAPTPIPVKTATTTLSGPTEVRLGAEDNGRQIELERRQILIVSLDSNPSTGYTWEIAEIDELVLCQVGKVQFELGSRMPGAPGQQVFRFEAMGAGQTSLRLIYHRLWETGVEPARTFYIQVIVR